MNDEKIVHVINKRNKAVFSVPLKDARELMENFEDFLETEETLPEEPKAEAPKDPEELKILGEDGEQSAKQEEETLPEEPKAETPKVGKSTNKAENSAK